MVSVVEFDSGRIAYPHVVSLVRGRGAPRAPRGLKTYDLGHTVITLRSPFGALPLRVGRGVNPVIAAAEAIQLVAGKAVHHLLPTISPAFTRYVEPVNGRFHGAYGDRIRAQVGQQFEKLRRDPDTRQAVVTLWDPTLDNYPDKRDYPCTVALHLALVDGKLELHTLMRSNDVWLGLPYDMFQFTQLQLTLARALGVQPGPYTHETWSLHLYEEHYVQAGQLQLAADEPGPYAPDGFGRDGDDWWACWQRANLILAGKGLPDALTPWTESEMWYVDQLASYVTHAAPEAVD